MRVCGSTREARGALSSPPGTTFLLTDLRLGGNDGGAADRVRKAAAGRSRPKFIVIITGHATSPEAVGNFGADLLYFKPIDPFAVLDDLTGLHASTAMGRFSL